MEARIGILRVRAPIRVDAAQPVAVGFAEHGDLARCEQEFERVVGHQHPGRRAFGQALDEQRRRPACPLLRHHVGDLRRPLRRPRRHVGADLGVLVGNAGSPAAASIRQFGEVGSFLRGRRGDEVLVGRILGRCGGRPKYQCRGQDCRQAVFHVVRSPVFARKHSSADKTDKISRDASWAKTGQWANGQAPCFAACKKRANALSVASETWCSIPSASASAASAGTPSAISTSTTRWWRALTRAASS